MSPANLDGLRHLLESLRISFADAGELEEIVVEEELVEAW
jgi:hypothetical protein